MAGVQDVRRSVRAAAILASLLAALFLATPLLLEFHDHSDLTEDTHCTICLFASAHVSSAPAPYVVTPPITWVTLVLAAPVTPVSNPHPLARNERAPPVV
jgi:hypothetical protein